MTEETTCATCRFRMWLHCHRFPPSAKHGFAAVRDDLWCGEHQPHDALADADGWTLVTPDGPRPDGYVLISRNSNCAPSVIQGYHDRRRGVWHAASGRAISPPIAYRPMPAPYTGPEG